MKQALQALLEAAVAVLAGALLPEAPAPGTVLIERTRDSQHGDFTSHVALRLARSAGIEPHALAQAIAAALPANTLIARTEVAGAGFLNFFLSPQAYAAELARIHQEGARYGCSPIGEGARVLVEIVSAPAGASLTVEQGRQAAYGATLADLLEAVGYSPVREYAISDGRPADILAVSAWVRYLELCGETLPFPMRGDPGEPVRLLGASLLERFQRTLHRSAADVLAGLTTDGPRGDADFYIDALIERARTLLGKPFQVLRDYALAQRLADIQEDLEQLGVRVERWFSRESLTAGGAVDRAMARLLTGERLYIEEGELWYRATELGDGEDRRLMSDQGARTECVLDIAYQLEKRERGFPHLINVRGADQPGYAAQVQAGFAALGEPAECLEVMLIESVHLFRGPGDIPIHYVPGEQPIERGLPTHLRPLREELGKDACRFFFLMRHHGQRLDFDLAQPRNIDNPQYCVQYAHARVASLLNEVSARGFSIDLPAGLANVALLTTRAEQAVLASLTGYPEAVEQAALQRAPHLLVLHLRELAEALHRYHREDKWLPAAEPLRQARLALLLAVQQVIRNGLTLLGVTAPESM